MNLAAISLLGLREPHPLGGDARKLFADAGYPEVAALLDEIRSAAVPSGTRRNVFRMSGSDRIRLEVTVQSPSLPRAMTYNLTYRRR